MDMNRERLGENVRRATTEDLLDRVTVYRNGMEPDALEIIERELGARGLSDAQIEAHGQDRAGKLLDESGVALRCFCCERPAVTRGWRWCRLFWLVPFCPWPAYFCSEHDPKRPLTDGNGPSRPHLPE